jgi:hypothetical protein
MACYVCGVIRGERLSVRVIASPASAALAMTRTDRRSPGITQHT